MLFIPHITITTMSNNHSINIGSSISFCTYLESLICINIVISTLSILQNCSDFIFANLLKAGYFSQISLIDKLPDL